MEQKEVEFYGDKILVVKSNDEKIYVPMRRLVENLGLSWGAQAVKLKAEDWQACVAEIATPDSSGRVQVQLSMELDAIPFWLSTIQVNKVKAPLRDKLRLYKAKVKETLARVFIHGDTVTARPQYPMTESRFSLLALVQMGQELLQNQERQAVLETKQNLLEQKVEMAQTSVKALAVSMDLMDNYYAAKGFASKMGVPLDNRAASIFGKLATRLSKEKGILIGKATHELYGSINTYFEPILEEVWRNDRKTILGFDAL